MNKNAMIQTIPAVAGLNRVPGFDPLRYLKRVDNARGEPVLRLELGYQKLWFRMACPNGRLLLNPLRITDQMALIEASVFFDRADNTPASSFTASKTAKESSGYIRDAQNEALAVALENAGFGIQLCDMAQVSGSGYGSDIPASRAERPAAHNDTPAQTNAVQQDLDQPTFASAQVMDKSAQPEPETSLDSRQNVNAAATGQPKQAVSGQAEQNPAQRSDTQTVNEAQMMAERHPEPSPAQTDTCEPETSSVENDPNSQSKAQKSAGVEVVDFWAQIAKRAAPIKETPEPEPSAERDAALSAPSYPADMPVEEICKTMTLEEARAVVVPTGTCKGWTIEKVAADRRSSLKFYVYSQGTVDNVVKAAATLLWNEINQEKAG